MTDGHRRGRAWVLLAAIACTSASCRSGGTIAAADASQPPGTYVTDPECRFIRTNQVADPQALVSEYVRRTDDGQFLSRWEGVQDHAGPAWIAWLESAVTCPGRLLLQPTPPQIAPVIISGRYSVGVARLSGDRAIVPVRYHELGRLEFGKFSVARRQHDINIVVRKTPWGWRIEYPATSQRVSVDAALSRIHLLRATQEQLEEARKAAR